MAPTIEGPLAGRAFSVTSPVLAQYSSSGGGPSGQLGAPTDNVHLVNGLEQQDFEGGYINYAPGSTVVNLVSTPRQPLVTATPSSVISGTTVHLVVGGFNNNATVRVSQTGQPDFVVTVASGAYAWDTWVPAAAVNGVVTISATDVNSAATAQGTYTVRSASSTPLTISMVSGNEQNGAPGSSGFAQPLVVLVQDQNGNPVPDQTVTFAASPGAQIVPASATTGANGHASATLRLPTDGRNRIGDSYNGTPAGDIQRPISGLFPRLLSRTHTGCQRNAGQWERYHPAKGRFADVGCVDPQLLPVARRIAAAQRPRQSDHPQWIFEIVLCCRFTGQPDLRRIRFARAEHRANCEPVATGRIHGE